MTSTRDLLAQLVATDTTSSRPNEPIIDLLAGWLAPLGFSLERVPYRDAAGVPKQNLVARLGAGQPALALLGHTDTVPFDPAWTEALSLTERGGALVGRGACDTKGFIAAAVSAVSRLDLSGLRAPLALIFTADEEVSFQGAKRLVEARAAVPRLAIVGEPTGLRPIRAHKGYCLAEVEVRGREGHSSDPASGASAIFAAGRLLARVEALAEALRADLEPAFEPPFTTINVGRIAGGSAANVIPGHCRFAVEWRPLPARDELAVLERLKAEAAEVASETGTRIAVELSLRERGLSTPAESALVRFLEERSGRPAGTASYGTEAPLMASLGAEAVVFGPGDIRLAHQTGESVPATELEQCAAILADAVRRFCG